MEHYVEALLARVHFKEQSVWPFSSLIEEMRETQETTKVGQKDTGVSFAWGGRQKGEALRRLCDIQLEVALLKKEIL